MSINRVPVTKNVPPAVGDRLEQSMHTNFQLLENHQSIHPNKTLEKHK
jgi:hypothetical protein